MLSFKQFDLDAALPAYVSFLAASDDPTVILDAPIKQGMECHASLVLPHTEPKASPALSSGESEMYALGARSAELIVAQAILKEIGLSFLTHARADSSTTRAVATKQGASRKMKHIHTRFLFIQDLVFRKLLTMSSVKTDVNPSDIGTKALGRERVYRLRSMLGMGTELTETSSPGKWYSGDE